MFTLTEKVYNVSKMFSKVIFYRKLMVLQGAMAYPTGLSMLSISA